ncbi:type II toxin-antitoxin system PemK/MazF family toxin [Virgibacillus sp. DJP39]|uniref:type II toxin-antitoxin system PemK/MazF family toxin n=1 Tax=Virgibacillus sp. DJP39 TaxID=3409790 RepID=UPI003BB5A1A0
MQIPGKGDLVYLNFNPQSGHRPAIVLSDQSFNQATKFALVCPVTSKVKGYPFEVKLPEGLIIEGVILTDQIKSMDWKSRNLKIIGQAPLEVVEKCIKLLHTILPLEGSQ